MPEKINSRIHVLKDIDVLEIDFSDIVLKDKFDVDAVYDTLESRIAATGQDRWFFLENMRNVRILEPAWFRYSLRSQQLRRAHAAGLVRFDNSEDTAQEIARRAHTAAQDDNLFTDRAAAISRILEMRKAHPILHKVVLETQYTDADFAPRFRFDPIHQVLDIDLEGIRFENSADVAAFFDYAEALLAQDGDKWYFLLNYHDVYIDPGAWLAFGVRSQRLILARALGAVRYNTSPEAAAEIRARRNTERFDPDICASRETALARVREMQRSRLH